MDLSFLDKSSGVTPLLVRLYDSHKLYSLAKDKKPLARAELTTVVTDLLGMELSPREGELVADVLIALLRQAEKDLRQALSERLSVIDNVPLRLVLQIANDEIEVAAPVLRNSIVLGDLDLIYIIKSKDSSYWKEVAARASLSDQIVDLLADTRDFDTALQLVKNENIELTDHSLTVLSDIARENEELATPLLRRSEVTPEIAGKLYQYVGQGLKQYIIETYDLDKSVMIDAIDEVVLELAEVAEDNEFIPNASALKSADRFKEKGLLTIHLMLVTLKRGQIQSFAAQFSRFTNLEPKVVAEILLQPNGQGLAIACKAFSIMKSDFISIYLLTNRVRNEGRMIDLNDMTKALHYFDSIKPEVAKRIIGNSQHDNTTTH